MWQLSFWRKVLIGVACLCFALSRVHYSRAAGPLNAPLIIAVQDGRGSYFESEYYAWTGTDQPLKNLTKYGWNGAPILSPDNRYIAYLTMPEAIKKGMVEDGFSAAGVYPADVSLLDLTTGEVIRISGHPSTLSASECMARCLFRSPPTWSPDSTMVAWAEVLPTDRTTTAMMVYDIATKTARAIVTKLDIMDMYVNRIYWGIPGLAVWDFTEKNNLKVYDSTGKTLFATTLFGNGNLEWVKDEGHDYLRVEATWGEATQESPFLLDIATKQHVPAQQQELELYSLHTPDGASILQTHDSDGSFVWQLHMKAQEPLTLGWADDTREGYERLIFNIAISPDGQQVAYSDHQKIVIYSEGQTVEVLMENKGSIFGVAWGAMGWRVANTTP